MTDAAIIASHYATGGLLERILAALDAAGADPAADGPAALAPVDAFHMGGAEATRALLSHVRPTPGMRVLDIGSGVGGAARLMASEFGAAVHGIDLTPEFVETARALSEIVGLSDQTRFELGSALDLPTEDAAFDGATMLHVGMNIPDKAALMREVARSLTPGGWFAIYDVMRMDPTPLTFPVPWATTAEGSFVSAPDAYRTAAAAAGFTVAVERNRRAEAITVFDAQRARIAADGPPPLRVHLLMRDAPLKLSNMIDNLSAGRIAPVELVLRKTG